MIRVLAIALAAFSLIVTSLPGQAQQTNPQALDKRISGLEAKNNELELRLKDHTAHTEAISQVSQASLSTVESMLRTQAETMSKIFTVSGGIVALLIGVGSFFGLRTWRDMQGIRQARKEAEEFGERIKEKVRFDELTSQVRLYLDCNQIDEALSALDEIMGLKTLNGTMERQYVYFNRALCLKRRKRPIEAFKNAIKAAEIWPSLAKAWYNAACYASLASTFDPQYQEEAYRCLLKAYELSPSYTSALALAVSSPTYDTGAKKKPPTTPDPDFDPIRETDKFKEIFRNELGRG